MPETPISSNPIRPLSIGNVVSAGIRLYSSHLKSYLGLALVGALWSLVPIYGWAKSCVINATIARHAFSELIDNPESVNTIRNALNPRLWDFFVTQLLFTLILFGANLALSLLSTVIVIIPILVIRIVFPNSSAASIISNLISLTINIATFLAYIWIYSRIMIAELPIAVETNVDAVTTISRSWELTNGSVARIQGVVLVAGLMTAPIFALALTPSLLMFPLFMTSKSPEYLVSLVLLFVLVLGILFILANIFIMPFWQAIKAVIYYDLRSRREGLDLQLHERDQDV